MKTEPKGCNGRTRDTWSSHRCGVELRTEEQKIAGLCGKHLAGHKISERAAEKRRQRNASADAKRAEIQALCDQLSALGVDASPHYNLLSRFYTGSVVVHNPNTLIERIKPRD